MESSSGPQMDQDTALDLVKKGSTLLLLDVPQFTLFGIDTQMFTVGPKFKGIKMIPPGPHFVYYNASDKEGNEYSPTVGFFINTSPSEVVVRRWHQQEERIVKLPEDEEIRYSEAVKRLEFDHQLGPYAFDHFGEWKQLSSFITKDVIERIEPVGGEISIIYESKLVDKVPRTSMEKRLAQQLKDSKVSQHYEQGDSQKRRCYFTAVPNVVKQQCFSGQELTSLNVDKSNLLENILKRDYGGSEDLLLGELQFSFVVFMMGQSLEAFLQWKALLSLFLSCTEAPLRKRTQLFVKFTRVVYYELKHGLQRGQKSSGSTAKGVSITLDDAWFSRDTFLFHLCKEYFPVVLESTVVDGDLLTWTRKLKKLLETLLGWDFQDNRMDVSKDDDEYAPAFVPPEEAMIDESS